MFLLSATFALIDASYSLVIHRHTYYKQCYSSPFEIKSCTDAIKSDTLNGICVLNYPETLIL